ncbi:hypothetical protein GCM10010279_30540 [Streptomyces mutabilis]|nr:hypothetical protein GCM10010279_30540 [Streptomyces mutabilis]
MADRTVADTAVATAVERFGSLDVVNNASVSRQKPLEERTDDDWALAMDTGPYATRNFMLTALPELKKTGNASVISLGSGAGLNGSPAGRQAGTARPSRISTTRSAKCRTTARS